MSTVVELVPAKQEPATPPAAKPVKHVVWGVTDGSAGTTAQVKSLAAAMGCSLLLKKTTIRKPLVLLPNHVFVKPLQGLIPAFTHTYDDIGAPWPDLVISCGRRGALASLGIKSRIGKQKDTRFVHIHDPQLDARNFDCIVAMQHDKVEGPNVIKTQFALHDITPEVLAAASEKFARRFSGYSKPYVAVLLGGTTNKYALSASRMTEVIALLRRAFDATKGSLLITPSRRTGYANQQALIDAFPRVRDSRVYVYDGISENPYLGMLAMAEYVLVTNDSVNMMSEAVATGKPVYILRLPGHQNTKPARFAEKMISQGYARWFEGEFDRWDYAKSEEMQHVAADIKQRLGW